MNRRLGYITGATGCVGRNLVEELLLKDWDVVVLHRKSSNLTRLEGCPVRFQEVDLHDPASVRASIPSGVDAIFHVAGNTSHWSAEKEQQWKDNVLATRNLVQAALERNVKRFLYTSTGATRFYQECDEALASRLEPPYVRTKRLAELEVYSGMQRGLDAIILHPIIVVGAYDYNSYSQIFDNLKSSPVKVAFPGKITFCHARDVANAHVQAFERGRSCERYVLGGHYAPWHDFFQKAAEIMGLKGTVHTVPSWILTPVAHLATLAASITRKSPLLTPQLLRLVRQEPEISTYDTIKSKTDLGYESRSLDVMVQDCFEWLIREGRV